MEDLKKDAEDNKIMAFLAYWGILFLVPLLAAKDSPFAKFHANQGCVLFIVEIAIVIAMTIVGFIPFIGWILAILIYLLYLVCFVFAIIGMINAFKGEMKELPIIGKYTVLK
jgi:uncharacterized membrane protein